MVQAERAGLRKLIAVVGNSAYLGSVGVHAACDFQHVGVLANCAWKFERWLDVMLRDRMIGLGSTQGPAQS